VNEYPYEEFKIIIEKFEKQRWEMDALWIHIRNLEEKLLAKSEVPKSSKPNCY
jgi:hypothetical protein